METLLLATHNQGKISELKTLLEGHVGRILSADDIELPEPEETEDSFAGNALLKARHGARISGLPVLADDSGLCVNALNGAPGIYSARWAGAQKDFLSAMDRVHSELGENADRSASFVCVLALVFPDGQEEIFEGHVEGDLVTPIRGDKGFGYDPMFQPYGYDLTFGEMSAEQKRKISHRTCAMQKLLTFIKT